MPKKETEDFKFESYDVCKATLPNEETFTCELKRFMRQWDFAAWEVRITQPSHKLGWTTHVREEQLELIERPEERNVRTFNTFGY